MRPGLLLRNGGSHAHGHEVRNNSTREKKACHRDAVDPQNMHTVRHDPLNPFSDPLLRFHLDISDSVFSPSGSSVFGRWGALVVVPYSLLPSCTLFATLVPGRRDFASNHFPINAAPTLGPGIEIGNLPVPAYYTL